MSNPASPKQVLATTVNRASGGGYRVSFTPSADGGSYLALTPGAARAPLSMVADAPSNLRNTGNRADYVIIAPLQLKDAAQALATYRQSRGLVARVVELEDIYDEFNYGIASPEAIKAFLSYAYNRWAKAPSYVLLAGEGSYDYKDNLGFGDNLIPVWMAGTPNGLSAADNWFADVVGADGVPDMAIGRLPVVTAQELAAMVVKIVSYERDSGAGWANRVIMLADNGDVSGDFSATSDEAAALLTGGYTADRIYLGEQAIGSARSALLAKINAGAGLLNYVGHAGMDKLADEGLLTMDDVNALSNGTKLPVATLMTCAAVQHAMPGYDSIGEALLLREGGGAVAVWAPTGLSLNSEATLLDEAFFRALFQKGIKPLGKAVRSALQEYAVQGKYPATLAVYNLLGDPALEVK